MEKIKLPTTVKIFIYVLIFGSILSGISSIGTGVKHVYNKSIEYQLEYKSLEQKQITTFDNYYLAFKEKSNIANLNKETFVMVTSIIMNGRSDGNNVAWKWVRENQNIPYEEFTNFYKDLSTFVATRFSENNKIEKEKQQVVKNHNQMITCWPGVFYNSWLKRDELIYREGFISKDTKILFNK